MTSRADSTADMVSRLAVASNPTTRFAPSPNGPLHLGHAIAALFAHDVARTHGGTFLLRIEDIDGVRSHAEHVSGAIDDLAWLALVPDAPPVLQSTRIGSYRAALERLRSAGLLYPCFCTRSEIAAALRAAPQRHGPDGPHYPGTCRALDPALIQDRLADPSTRAQWRLRMGEAAERTGPLTWRDLTAGVQHADPLAFGDVVLWRKDAPASYHLAATIDDATDRIDTVVRGMDLFAYSGLHRLLQALLDLPQPVWWHHPLVIDAAGEKLAKRRGSTSLAALRMTGENGIDMANRLRRLDLPQGLTLDGSGFPAASA